MKTPPRSERERDLLREITELTAGRPRARRHDLSAPPPAAARPEPVAPEAPVTDAQEEL